MRKILCTLLLSLCLLVCSGCTLLEGTVSDVQGWDLSACVDGFGTCWDLFWDNSDKFEDGFTDAMAGL
jgi:hypothetical protein